MNIKNQNNPKVLRKIKNNTNSTPRNLSHQFELILGKLKYFINALIGKSFVKITKFKKNTFIFMLLKFFNKFKTYFRFYENKNE